MISELCSQKKEGRPIYSLKREDAARLGYETGENWRRLLLAHQTELATAMKIPPSSFRWCAAFHDEKHHPHIHMMAWSADPKQGYLTEKGIEQMRSQLSNDIFQDELLSLYQEKDLSYQEVRDAAMEAMPEQTDEPPKQDFVPVEPPRRRPGTGCVSQLREHLWEGRYSPVWPDGKKHSRNVYAKTCEECEEKLKTLILEMKAEIAALRSGASTEYPDGVSTKKKAIAAYLRKHPGVSSKSLIARELQMNRSTVRRYYDEIRAEIR